MLQVYHALRRNIPWVLPSILDSVLEVGMRDEVIYVAG
jgi:hypothetical protein